MVKKRWILTPKRKIALHKAQQVHKYLVELGKRARAKGMR